MARRICPACGSSYNGRKCSACLYVPMEGEVTYDRNNRGVESSSEHSPRSRRIVGTAVFVAVVATLLPMLANFALGLLAMKEPEPVVEVVYSMPDFEFEELVVPTIGDISIEIPDTPGGFVVPDSYPTHDFGQAEEDVMEIPVEGTVLYDADDVLVVADWREGEPFPGDLPIYIQNDSPNGISVTNTSVFVNDFFMESAVLYAEVPAGQTVCDWFWQDIEGMQSAGIETAAQMTFRLEILDMDTYTFLEESEEIVLEFEVPGDFVQPVNDSGLILLNQGGLKMVCQGYGEVNGLSNTVGFYFENGTQQEVEFSVNGMRLNGEFVDCYGFVTLPGGTRAVNDLFLFFTLEGQGIQNKSDIESLELKISVYDSETYNIIQDLGWVSLDLG